MADETNIYPLRLATSTKVIVIGVLGVMTLVGLAIPFAEAQQGSLHPTLFALFWFGGLGFMWFQVLSLPQAIIHHPDDSLEFKAPLRTRSITIADLQAIEPVPSQFGMLCFRSRGGKVNVLNQFDGFHWSHP